MPTASPPLDHADRARLAHRALRLRESGYDKDSQIKDLAFQAPAGLLARSLLGERPSGDQRISGVPSHAGIALELFKVYQPELPGPTDRKLVEKLMATDLRSIHREWDDAVTANLEATLSPADLKRWRESVERDRKSAERSWEQAGFTEQDIDPRFGHLRHHHGAANALYDKGREGHLDASIDWDTAVIKVDLVDSADYSVNLATHQFRSSVASGGRVASSSALTSKTVAAGVADADDITFSSVSGDQSEALVGYQASAVGGGADVADTAQRLIFYMDTATGLPVTPNGGNITVAWDSGSNRIFKL